MRYMCRLALTDKSNTLFFVGFYRKARRKERDGDQSATTPPLYLEENVLERKLPDADLKMMVDLPAGLDFNEWLASHSMFTLYSVHIVKKYKSLLNYPHSIGTFRTR